MRGSICLKRMKKACFRLGEKEREERLTNGGSSPWRGERTKERGHCRRIRRLELSREERDSIALGSIDLPELSWFTGKIQRVYC